MLNGQLKESLKTYRKAFNMDETSLPALGGIIHCQLIEGQISEAEQQLDFLAEVSKKNRIPRYFLMIRRLNRKFQFCKYQSSFNQY